MDSYELWLAIIVVMSIIFFGGIVTQRILNPPEQPQPKLKTGWRKV